MLTSPTSIRVFVEAGKKVALHAKGVAALLVATGIGAAMVKAAQHFGDGASHVRSWITKKIIE